jgi:uncharacterized protein YndB with AHSA1/START domain
MIAKTVVAGRATTENEVWITREILAPRELVFRAWTDPKQLAEWFAPNGCTIEYRMLDVRTGGSFHSCIHTPDGKECWCIGAYREVVPPERIVMTMEIADAAGNAIDAVAAGMDPEWPSETVVTVTFAESAGGTKMTLHQTVSEALAKRTGAHPSWLQMFDRLAARLASAST